MTISSDEYPPYYRGYIEKAPVETLVESLDEQGERLAKRWRSLPEEARGFRYAEGKWTVEEVIGHVIDIERAFSYRAMCFARGLKDEQPGVDQDIMVPHSKATARGLESLCTEFEHLRRSNVSLFGAMGAADLGARGRASGAQFSVRAIVAMLFGHAEHHAEVLLERYRRSD